MTSRVGISICDITCGMYAHSAILEALASRGITGEGSSIEVSLFSGIADWLTVPLSHYEHDGGKSSFCLMLNRNKI